MADSTMLGVLHGELTAHPWRESGPVHSDPYSLFYARSSGLRWLTDAAQNADRDGLWYMNDAGLDLADPQGRRLWFQVALNPAAPAGRALPTQPFLSCAGAVASRLGEFDVRAVQMLLPLQHLSATPESKRSAVMDLLQEAQWFADPVPGRARSVRLTLDSGQDPALDAAAPHLIEWMRGRKQSVVDRVHQPATDHTVEDLPPLAEHLWDGPGRYRAVLCGDLVEWSYQALGWAAAFVAEAAVQHNIRTPVLLTAQCV